MAKLGDGAAANVLVVDKKLRPKSRPKGGSLAWEDY
jgi:hypothetical protein